MIVQEQAEPDHPGRPLRPRMRQDEAHRPGDMAGDAQQDVTLLQRLAHQAELVVLEIAQAAMDELAGRGGGRARQIALFDEQHAQAAAGGIARDADAVDPAAHDQQVETRNAVRPGHVPTKLTRRRRRVSVSESNTLPSSLTRLLSCAGGSRARRYRGSDRSRGLQTRHKPTSENDAIGCQFLYLLLATPC